VEWFAVNTIQFSLETAQIIGAIMLIAIAGVVIFDLTKKFRKPEKDEKI
jgi:hypothetical protein